MRPNVHVRASRSAANFTMRSCLRLSTRLAENARGSLTSRGNLYSDRLRTIGAGASGGSAGATGLPLARRFKGTLLAQFPAGVPRHTNSHGGGPKEIDSEQCPKRNGAIPRQRTRLEEGHRGERDKAEAVKIAQLLTQRGNTGRALLSARPTRPAAMACTEVTA
jgi:hypothetical protein